MLDHLFSPCKIGNVEIANRLILSPMITNFSDTNCELTDKSIAYYEARAKGGWGLIISESLGVTPASRAFPYMTSIWDDRFLKQGTRLADTVHKYGSKIFAQMQHCGRQATCTGEDTEAPTAVPCPNAPDVVPHELTVDEIHDIVRAFGESAARAKRAGFDGIAVHFGHGYLPSAFMNPFSNHRIDEYGGCFENRMRFPREVIESIRAHVGADFPILIRISIDNAPGGIRNADVMSIAYYIDQFCPVDAIDVSCGTRGDGLGNIRPMYAEHAWGFETTSRVKKLVKVPVVTVGRYNDPFLADTVIASGNIDFVAMARQSLADPEFPNKARAGKFDSIRTCIGCCQGCEGALFGQGDKPISCLVNPSLGHEYCDDLSKVENPKNVVVIGGGPAGMEAARAAALRGNKVTLFEKADRLGGNFLLGSYPPGKGEIATYIRTASCDLVDLNVNVRLNEEATAEKIKALSPDTVIVATGGVAVIPKISGIDGANVVTAEDVLLSRKPVGQKIVVAGGGSVGAETAVFLGMLKKDVTIVEMLPKIAGGELANIRSYLIGLLDRFKVTRYVSTKITKITSDGVCVEQVEGAPGCSCKNAKIPSVIDADTVVLAFGYRPQNSLSAELEKAGIKVVTVGDASSVGTALDATRAGYVAGLNA